MSWGVFLDRDGTLVRDAVHPTRPEQLDLYASAIQGLRRLHGAGAKLVLVSNQSAVARGLLTAQGLKDMDTRIRELTWHAGAPLSATYYCPHHPDFTGPCSCRKPAPGLVEQGLKALELKAERCFLVGDTPGDMEAGKRLGLVTVLVLTGHGREARESVEKLGLADHVARDVDAAARWILRAR